MQSELFARPVAQPDLKNLDEYVSTDPAVDALIDAGASVLVCVSGGKDSSLAARAVREYCRNRGHRGEFRLIYADLNGPVIMTWHDAREQCSKLATDLNVPLTVVGRSSGGLLERWQQRQESNVRRYCELELVKTLLPWSTPSMRFCTSELKTAPIQRWIRQTYQTRPVVCVLGIRRDESNGKETGRAKAPVVKMYSSESGKTPALPIGSVDWNAIVTVSTPDVFAIHAAHGYELPQAYGVYGASRYSCCACIMAAQSDLEAACRDQRNHPAIVAQCRLELVSTFSFQGKRWLSDIARDILPADLQQEISVAKERARRREAAEALIPEHLLFENDGGRQGWPKVMPTEREAEQIAAVRQEVGTIMGWPVRYTEGGAVMSRYAALIREREQKTARKSSPRAKRSEAHQTTIWTI